MKQTKADAERLAKSHERIEFAKHNEMPAVFAYLSSAETGLKDEEVESSRDEHGVNTVTKGKKESWAKRLLMSFVSPFTGILLVLVVVSVFTNIIFTSEKNYVTVSIICSMILISGLTRFVQETRSGKAASRLASMIETTTNVKRFGKKEKEIPFREVVVGDIVYLSAGDLVPADMRVYFAKDLFCAQSSLTGESEPVEKFSATIAADSNADSDIVYMGTTVVSGSAKAVVISVGDDTRFGQMAKALANNKPAKTSFDKGIDSASWVLIRFMLVMVPIVLLINGFTKGNWMEAVLFALSIAVGLTPEMLPMIVTSCLAKGSVSMSKNKVIIKNINAIQNLGSMDILCTDKTGTLTQDKVILEYHLDLYGNEDPRVLRHAFLNSYYQTGLKNLMDLAIISHVKEAQKADPTLKGIECNYTKVDEIPFDFDRRRMSVVVQDKQGKTQMITKGAVEEMLSICSFVEYNGVIEPLTPELRKVVFAKVNELNDNGMRVIVVAQKTNPSATGAFCVRDESDMVLIGYLAFLDPPKDTAAGAVKALQASGVAVKVLTGDSDKVAVFVCKAVGLDFGTPLLGDDIDNMSDECLSKAAETTVLFAKLSPSQKARVVSLLRKNGHCVGYMGDGINDAAAMKASDVGISVDTAVDVAKESASVILLEKDLMVLEKGIVEGRKTYVNMIKYIKMTSSSNFGNMLSVVIASAWLPFIPMAAIQIILLDLIYDIACVAIPWDHVDPELIAKPKQWNASGITKFMIWIGPTSSIFDITTYALLFFLICPSVFGGSYASLSSADQLAFAAVFQTGWFIESMWTQTMVIHMIRTEKIPFIQSRSSWQVMVLGLLSIGILTAIPFTPLAAGLNLSSRLPAIFFAYLAGTVIAYMILVTVVKKVFIHFNHSLL